MIRKNALFAAFILSNLLMMSCSKQLSPFTEKLYKENNWGNKELKKIQFYVSHDVVLHREVTAGQTSIKSGKIKMVRGREVEEVVIPRGTPGTLVNLQLLDPGNKDKERVEKFMVCFEENDNLYLSFGPNPKRKGAFVLLADDWKNSAGKVHYGDEVFWAVNDSGLAALMVDLKRIQKTDRNSRVAKGRKID